MLRFPFLVALALTATLTVGVAGNGFNPSKDSESVHKRQQPVCDITDATPTTTAPRENVWAPITPKDNLAVWNLLHADPTLNLSDPASAALTDNYVFWIDTLHTNKSDMVPYLEDARMGPPPKYARVIIFRGAIDEPDSQEFMVGPLPVGPETRIERLDYIYNGGRGGSVPFNGRYFDGVRSAAAEPLLISVMAEVADITEELVGGVYYGRNEGRTNLATTAAMPMSFDGTTTFWTVQFRYPGPTTYLLPLDLYVMLDCPGLDPSKFKLKGIVTKSRFFPTTTALRAAWDAGELEADVQQTRDYDWALLDYKPEQGTRDLEDRLAPQSLEIGGRRYRLDFEQRYVEYMGWSFYLSFTRSLGFMFYDIRFRRRVSSMNCRSRRQRRSMRVCSPRLRRWCTMTRILVWGRMSGRWWRGLIVRTGARFCL